MCVFENFIFGLYLFWVDLDNIYLFLVISLLYQPPKRFRLIDRFRARRRGGLELLRMSIRESHESRGGCVGGISYTKMPAWSKMLFWRNVITPSVAKLVRKYLAVQAWSAASERLLSVGGNTITFECRDGSRYHRSAREPEEQAVVAWKPALLGRLAPPTNTTEHIVRQRSVCCVVNKSCVVAHTGFWRKGKHERTDETL